jgi:hypothetical protein
MIVSCCRPISSAPELACDALVNADRLCQLLLGQVRENARRT